VSVTAMGQYLRQIGFPAWGVQQLISVVRECKKDEDPAPPIPRAYGTFESCHRA
jgi:hypothetical protein